MSTLLLASAIFLFFNVTTLIGEVLEKYCWVEEKQDVFDSQF